MHVKSSPAFATSKMTESRVEIDAGGRPGLPQIRLLLTTVNADAQHYHAGKNDYLPFFFLRA